MFLKSKTMKNDSRRGCNTRSRMPCEHESHEGGSPSQNHQHSSLDNELRKDKELLLRQFHGMPLLLPQMELFFGFGVCVCLVPILDMLVMLPLRLCHFIIRLLLVELCILLPIRKVRGCNKKSHASVSDDSSLERSPRNRHTCELFIMIIEFFRVCLSLYLILSALIPFYILTPSSFSSLIRAESSLPRESLDSSVTNDKLDPNFTRFYFDDRSNLVAHARISTTFDWDEIFAPWKYHSSKFTLPVEDELHMFSSAAENPSAQSITLQESIHGALDGIYNIFESLTNWVPAIFLSTSRGEIYHMIFESPYHLYSYWYHSLRGVSVLKIYVVFNIIEIVIRLVSSLSGDLIEALWFFLLNHFAGALSALVVLADSEESEARKKDLETDPCSKLTLIDSMILFIFCIEPKGSVRRRVALTHNNCNAFLFFVFLLCLSSLVMALHSFTVLLQIVTMNVAMNSDNFSMLALLISNNFVEIKVQVFKKIGGVENLFQIACCDAVERVQLIIFTIVMLIRHSQSEAPFGTIDPTDIIVIFGFEIMVDFIKIFFACRFNKMEFSCFENFLKILLNDCAETRRLQQVPSKLDGDNHIEKLLTDYTSVKYPHFVPHPCQRLGFVPHVYSAVLLWVAMPYSSRGVSNFAESVIGDVLPLNMHPETKHFLVVWGILCVCFFILRLVIHLMTSRYIARKKHDVPSPCISALTLKSEYQRGRPKNGGEEHRRSRKLDSTCSRFTASHCSNQQQDTEGHISDTYSFSRELERFHQVLIPQHQKMLRSFVLEMCSFYRLQREADGVDPFL